MIKELKYAGYTANPSDYECQDGDLAIAVNVVPEDGALRPVLPPKEILQLGNGESVRYVHETSNYRHYICANEDNMVLFWIEATDDSHVRYNLQHTFSGQDIYQITAMGNTLLVLASDGMHYFLWKDNVYLYLGTEIPECPLSFGLQGEMKSGDEFRITFDNLGSDHYSEFSEENKKKISEQVLAKVNKFIADNATNKGKFIYPFLVRYAYRLYDETLIKHSAPILMIATSGLAPQALLQNDNNPSDDFVWLQLCGIVHTLDYVAVDTEKKEALMLWQDIVKSVEVFISKPIYTYDQTGQCTKFSQTNEEHGQNDYYSVSTHTNQSPIFGVNFPPRYQKRTFGAFYTCTYTQYIPQWVERNKRLLLPERSEEDVRNDIKNCSLFYLLKSIKVEDLATESREAITVGDDYLGSLVTREVMTDDYDSHDKIIPQYAFAYNSRMNVCNLKKQLFTGHAASCLFSHTDGYIEPHNTNLGYYLDGTYDINVRIMIKQDGRDIIVKCDEGTFAIANTPILYLYYPNPNAYKAVVYSCGTTPWLELPLEKHSLLHGAFYFNGWAAPPPLQATDLDNLELTISPVAERTIDIKNKIYTSEVNNPFLFPLAGIGTVGTGEIYGIRSAAKALSEGQYGQFPLYAFSTEGVWALEVKETGLYKPKQPVTRDICLNTDSITQIDTAVLFATERGIMLITGSKTQCITDGINAPVPFGISDLPRHEGVVSVYNNETVSDSLTADDINLLPFVEFLSGCRMIYDYRHQHIIVYNTARNVRYAYVYSLKSQAWGMILTDVYDNVNSYPEALAMSYGESGPVLVDFSKSSADSTTGLIVTRPVKMDDPNVFKTIDTIIQRGFLVNGTIRQVLYGSNDLCHWHVIWSSADKYLRGFRGTPYKAFRLAMVCTMGEHESLFGCTVQFVPRRLNRPR